MHISLPKYTKLEPQRDILGNERRNAWHLVFMSPKSKAILHEVFFCGKKGSDLYNLEILKFRRYCKQRFSQAWKKANNED